MRSAHPITITLPHEMAAMVKAKIERANMQDERESSAEPPRHVTQPSERDWLDEGGKSYMMQPTPHRYSGRRGGW